MEHIEMLPLVLMDAFCLNIEERVGFDFDAGALFDQRGKTAFGGEFYFPPELMELGIIGKSFELAELVKVTQPAVTDATADKRRQLRITDRDEPPRRNAIGNIAELLRPHLGKILHHQLPEHLRVHPCHAVDVVTAHCGKMGHTHISFTAFIDKRHSGKTRVIAGKLCPHFIEKTAVDFIDDFKVPRQQLAEQTQRPFLQRLGQKRMIGIGKGMTGNVPGSVPVKLVFVDEDSHQFRHGNRRVRVVKLDGKFFVKLVEPASQQQMHANHILQRTGGKKELLLQAKGFALHGQVIGIQDLGDIFREYFIFNRTVVIAVIERGKIERLDGLGLPEAQSIARAHAIAENGRIIRHALDHRFGYPSHTVTSLLVRIGLGMSAKLYVESQLGPGNLPRVAKPQPLVGNLDLPAVADDLVEDAELITNAIPDGRHFKRRERIHITRRQPPQAAVAKARLILLFQHIFQVDIELGHRLTNLLGHTKIKQVIRKMRAGQKLGGHIGDHARVLLGIRFERLHALLEHTVADGQRKRRVKVVACGPHRRTSHTVKQVIEK